MMQALHDALDGVGVVALATNIPGPLAAARLRAMGAHVVKIEPLSGDPLARAARGWYDEVCAGIDVRRLDLRDASARTHLDALIGGADVLITTMRAAAIARLGLEWNALHQRYARLSHVAVVGEAAPNGDRAGHDLTYQARAGLLSPPSMPRTLAADLAAAERVVSAAIAALLRRSRTGDGAYAEIAIVDAAIAFAAPLRHGLTAAGGALGGALPTYELYRARDGWIALAALETHFREGLGAMLGVGDFETATLRAAFAERSAAEWEGLAAERDVPLAAVATAPPAS